MRGLKKLEAIGMPGTGGLILGGNPCSRVACGFEFGRLGNDLKGIADYSVHGESSPGKRHPGPGDRV